MRKLIIAAAVTAAGATLAVANFATATTTARTETFTVLTSDPGSGMASLIATGRFTAGGTMVNGKRLQTLRFADGRFNLVIAAKPTQHVNLNATTCLYIKTGSAIYTLADGTGAYKGIVGSGRTSFTLRAAYPLVNGKCPSNDQPGGSGTPTAIQFTETASGPVSLS